MTASHKKVNAGTSKRVKTLSVTRPIIYGNTAKKLGETRPPNAPAEHTHIWTIFVRGPQNEDISYFIKKVVFKLHDTYPNATRTVDAPPFELTETGWGEFEINIKIHFVDEANEKMLSFYHHLRLHPYYNVKKEKQEPNDEISAIFYDEVVFNSPQPHLELSNTDSDLASLSKRKGPPISSRSPSVRKEVTNTATAVSAPPLVPKKKKPPVPSHALESAVQYPHTNAAEAASSEMTASEKDSPALSDKNQPTEPTLMPKDTNSSTSVTLIPKKKAPPVPSHSNGSVQSINTGTEFGPSNSQDDKTLSAPLPSSFPSGSNNSTAKDVAAKVVASNASDILAPKKDDTLMSPQSSGLTQPPLPADKEPGTVKKSPPAKPAKKPELEHLSLQSWKPLTPK